ncbi:MAG: EamA family transporter RarD [Kurthia sp.]|uniref:Chloramphenicol-sensitive protein RarD n=1 Tax=Kurthia zopfii TaxID=1650 RepID=A0A8B4QC73_9BACL|nr:EamA family transporter RarD [Kurthia zopfii]PWI23102.1 EamA family transporter RarD [Kurthia zopfii]TDR40567.1 chloramphenicol-sensitive protein RarD [Kurthia zopfii]GEK30126.1 transporter [Kurthia zopfii]STX10306.1 putative chloramphenical resistance permease RarD [Kurthia zopfii]
MSAEKKGVLAAALAYILWGLVPLYWKQLENVSSNEIITSRIVWSFVLTIIFVVLIKQWKLLISDVKMLWKNQKSFWALFAASYLISVNWYIFIWAVNNNHIIETSMGYYINPLISVLLGVIFLKEKLSKAQLLACIFALGGVLILVISYGTFPFVSLGLAFSFGIYGLLKKQIKLDATRGLVIETFFILPVALGYYIYLFAVDTPAMFNINISTTLLLIGTGAITAVPLILFAIGAQNIPLYLVGFFQYIAPTMTLIIGTFVYGEKFGGIELVAFSCIWIAIIIFSFATVRELKKPKLKKK